MIQPVLKTKTTELETENGMLEGQRSAAATSLRKILADTFYLSVSTQGVHWNVQGPLFYSIHKLTESQYEDMVIAIDDLAERIRALGFPAPASVEELVAESSLSGPSEGEDLKNQIERLVEGNEYIAQSLRKAAENLERLSDAKTSDMFTERLGVHEQNAWMLRATIS